MNNRNLILTYILLFFLHFSCTEKNVTSQSSDKRSNFIDSLMNEMTLEEKVGQMTLFTSGWDVTGPSLNDNYKDYLKEGKVGAIFNAHGVEYNTDLQRIAMEETRLGIPLLFGYDVIHGYKTIFPTPLAESSTWDLDIIEKSARLAAKEAASAGLNWTFNPMVDVARDPRWGRIAEGSGEDTYLGSLIGAAKVRGYQGDDLTDPFTMLACVKHFAAYGAAQAGRDYHTVDMSERMLRETYLPPYKAALEAGARTVMTSFNELDGVPASGSHYLMTEILRDEWGFDGFVVTDYTAINEMIPHGVAADEKQAAKLAANAGVDMDMQGATYLDHLKELVEEGKVDQKAVDQSVRLILEAKYDLGLFKDPYLYLNKQREEETVFAQEMMDHSYLSALHSAVLLKNEDYKGSTLLPLDQGLKTIALIGPLADNQEDLLGTWHASGDETKVVTLKAGLEKALPNVKISTVKGAGFGFGKEEPSDFTQAILAAKSADIIILALGENYRQSGEAASRTEIGLPGDQDLLIAELEKLNKPMVAVVMAGRPLDLTYLNSKVPAILNAWHLGTRAGDAIASILTGEYNPSGKLTVTFPRNLGQVPIYYSMKNTGRPFEAQNKFTSKYLDSPNEPLYPFGYGLSYTNFEFSDLSISSDTVRVGETLTAQVTLKNTGDKDGTEVVQWYIKDHVGSVTRPVKELKGYKKIMLKSGEEKTVTLDIEEEMLKFYDREMVWTSEEGDFTLFVGPHSATENSVDFYLKK